MRRVIVAFILLILDLGTNPISITSYIKRNAESMPVKYFYFDQHLHSTHGKQHLQCNKHVSVSVCIA